MDKIICEFDIKEFPILANIEKDKLDYYVKQIFKTGYNIHFPVYQGPEYNMIITKIEQIDKIITLKPNLKSSKSKSVLCSNL